MISTQGRDPKAAPEHQIDEDRLAWLALTLSPALGPKRILDAMQTLQTPSRVFALSLTDLEGLRFPAEAAQFIFDGKARCRLTLPVIVCLGIEKRDGSPKIKHSASLSIPLVQQLRLYRACDLAVSQPRWTGCFR